MAALDDRISHGRAFSQQKLQVLNEKTVKARETVQDLQKRKDEVSAGVEGRLLRAE